jgi:site-specific recombinase XerD
MSKHQDKKEHSSENRIYSFATFEAYKKVCCKFALYTRYEHKCKNLSQARKYVNEFLKSKVESGYSPYSIKLYANALGKLYNEPTTNFIKTPNRERVNIFRSRSEHCIRDKHFSINENKELIEFCVSTGLRRRELENIRRDSLIKIKNQYFIIVENGKGGKRRLVPIINNNLVVLNKFNKTKSGERVWGRIHNACDVHAYRREYANLIYEKYSRQINTIPRNERYYCRKDMKGSCYDKKAMLIVSRALGHERISVIAYSYLKKLSNT